MVVGRARAASESLREPQTGRQPQTRTPTAMAAAATGPGRHVCRALGALGGAVGGLPLGAPGLGTPAAVAAFVAATRGAGAHWEARAAVSAGSADALADSLLGFGAQAVLLEAAPGGQEPLLSSKASAGPCKCKWRETLVVATFADADAAAEGMASCEAVLGTALEYTVKEVRETDWVAAVNQTYAPLRIAEGLWIVPTTEDPPEPEAAVNILLEPGPAFGNGGHPTTALCLRWLQQTVRGGEAVVDYGAGTGVLGIGALKLGAASCLCTDIEAETAVRITAENARVNGEEGRVQSVLVAADAAAVPSPADGTAPGDFDVLVSNILLGPLLELRHAFLGALRPGGAVGLSGILAGQADEVAAAYRSAGLEEVTVTTLGEWALVAGRKGAGG